jgi:hypothetical protein
MTINIHVHCAAIGLMIFLSSLPIASAQSASALRPRPANEVVASFEIMTNDLKVVRPREVQHPEEFSTSRVDSVLGGLERIAQTATSSFLSTSAVAALMDAGSADKAPPGIFDRQMRLYRSGKSEVRALIVDFMPEQKDRIHALAFLKSVASQSGAQRDYENSPRRAVEALSLMGNDGRAALTDLRTKGLLRDPQARNFTIWFLNRKVTSRPAR